MATRRKNSGRKGPYRHRGYGRGQIQELAEIDAVLEDCDELAELVEQDLRRASVGRGDESMTARQVLRAYIIREMNEYDWTTLEWQLVNLGSYRRFCGTEDIFPEYFRRPTLEAHLGALSSKTIARLHQVLMDAHARVEPHR